MTRSLPSSRSNRRQFKAPRYTPNRQQIKIAVLADVHANLPGLHAVSADLERWQPHLVLIAGDTLNRGPRPLECWEFIRTRQQNAGWQVIRGNHEDYILTHSTQHYSPLELSFHQVSYWTYQQILSHLPEISALSDQFTYTAPDGSELRLMHASMLGNRDGIYPETTEYELREKIAPAPAVFLTGHTHRPLIRQIDQTLVINVGSAGLPFDGDPRPSYAQLTWEPSGWQAQIVRVEYNLRAAVRDFFTTGFYEQAGPLTRLMLVELVNARSLLFSWVEDYRSAVLAGQISVAQAVQQFTQRYPALYDQGKPRLPFTLAELQN